MSRHVPMLVRAHLASGIAQAAPWGIALDGLLASEIWAEMKAEARSRGEDYVRAMDQPDPPDLDLPLARCTPADGPWHWAATCAYPEQSSSRVDVRVWTGRVDHRPLEQAAVTLPRVISSRQGRYRTRRMPLLVTPCQSVTWHAVGDIDAVRKLLQPIRSIGKKRTTGEGQVLGWEVHPSATDTHAAAHLHPDGTLGRPTPAACITPETVDGGLGRAGIRPPYMHLARQHGLRLPAPLAATEAPTQ